MYNYIDCDVHHILPNFDTLMPYIEPGLRRRIELASNARAEARNNFQMPRRAYFNPTSTARVDTIELQTGVISIGIQNTISLVCEGVFAKFPTLKVALLEYGWTWLPGLMWRLDREWLSFRAEVPWVTKPPSEYIKEHIRVGSQPLEAPSKAYLHQTLEMMSADKMMLFATDYPHWDFDDPNYVMRNLPGHMRDAIAYENARALYGL